MEPSDGQTSVQVHTDGTADTNVTVRADSDQAAAEAQTDVAAADQAAARAAAEDRGADPTGDRIKPESKGMRADQPAGYDEAAKDLQSAEERAEIASARASDAQVVMSIESSGGLPQARLDLIREGDAWKIDLDDSVSDAELTSNLARHLEQAVAGIDQWPQDAAGARQAIAHHVVLGLSSP
jgi:hypothetical protein